MAYSDLLQPFNIFGSTATKQADPVSAVPAPPQTPTPTRDALPGEVAYNFNSDGTMTKSAPTSAPPAPKLPMKAPAPSPTYSFLDGSTYNSQGKQISPPTVVTGKTATEDLMNKKAALDQVTTAQTQQATATAPAATQPAPAPAPAPAATADDLQRIMSGEAGVQGAAPVNNALKEMSDAADNTFNSLNSQLNQVLTGTFPLTPAQKAQINATQNSFNEVRRAQETANQNLLGQIRVMGAVSGRNMTAPLVETGLISAAVNSGIQQISSIDSQASKAVADLQQGFMDSDYKMINDAYDRASKLFAQKSATIQQMNDNVRQATNDALTLHKQQVDEQQAILKPINDIMTLAAQNGASKETLDKIGSSKSVAEAISVAGYDLGAQFRQKVAQQEFDNKIQQGQLAVSQANTGIARARLNFDMAKEAYDQAQKTAGAVSPTMQQALAKSSIDLVGGLLKSDSLNAAVGTNPLARGGIHLGPIPIVPTTLKGVSGGLQDFISGVEQIRSQLNLQALIDAKAKGATFGALSDQEGQLLASAATKIGTWAIKDKNGKVTGYDASENDFKKELEKINAFAKLDYVLKGGNPTDAGVKQESDGTWSALSSDGKSVINLGK